MIPLLFAASSVAACASAPHPADDAVRARYLMGTTCSVAVPRAHAPATEVAFSEIERVERMLSTWRDDTELAALNAAAAGVPKQTSSELYAVLDESFRLARMTDGAFNPLIRPLLDAWKTREEGRIPDDTAIASALGAMELDLVEFDPAARRITRTGDAAFEEGGFGKGYALDRALAAMKSAAVPRAVIDFGGQVSLYGFAPALDVAIAHPEHRDVPVALLSIRDGSISTSSGSEKSFIIEGRRFSHLLDPRNGNALPPRGSVTVVDDSGLAADALSTALYVLGPAEGIAWADANGVAALFLVPSDSGIWEVRTSRFLRSRISALRIVSPNFILKD